MKIIINYLKKINIHLNKDIINGKKLIHILF